MDVIIVVLPDKDAPDKTGGGFDLNAVMVIPLLGVEANDETDVLVSVEVVGFIASITKLLLLTGAGLGVVDFALDEEGMTCKEDPRVDTTLTVGGVELMPGLLPGGSGINPLKLANISATFLRSTWVGLDVPLMWPPARACFKTFPEVIVCLCCCRLGFAFSIICDFCVLRPAAFDELGGT